MEPLAYRMRPVGLDGIIGQRHLIGESGPLRRMLEAKRLLSMILVGPPGIGKTTIAKVLAYEANMPFYELNAAIHGKKDLELVVKNLGEEVALLFIDEVHRLNKNIQEYLLPTLESGKIVLCASTTESVAHEIKPAIRSRCQVFELRPLSVDDVIIGLKRAMTDNRNGLGDVKVDIKDEVLKYFAYVSGGDLRAALNGLELAVISTKKTNGVVSVDIKAAEESMQRKSLHEAGGGTGHYDLLSNFQKAIRGSDVDAALTVLAVLLDSKDLKSVCRRLTVIAYEDIGLADTTIGGKVLAAVVSAERLGLPEARIPLAAITIELCLSPKSDSAYKALDKALLMVRTGKPYEVPLHLKDGHYKDAEVMGKGVGYTSPHANGGFVVQDYLPENWLSNKFYEPKLKGDEERLGERYYKIVKLKRNNEKER